MEADATSLAKRNQEAIGDKNKKLADLNAELTNIKTSLEAKESKCISIVGKFEEMQTSNAKKDKEIQDLSKTISELKQSNSAVGERKGIQLSPRWRDDIRNKIKQQKEKNKLRIQEKQTN
eukprot:TRINITY_DN14859_c0_g1_i1.p1 TRINITY_DN14859_c0_g1~~TRINITY_DN14859_c0_g1_i1.p1  ORF type:complete len:120 (+),score=41.65 TRINITY_DN14859_c0_g1_i1:571-930(+)